MQTERLTAVMGGEKSVSPTDMRQATVRLLLTCQKKITDRGWKQFELEKRNEKKIQH